MMTTFNDSMQTPMIPLNLGPAQIWAILDSGADISILSEEAYNKLISKENKGPIVSEIPTFRQVSGVTGTKLQTLGVTK